MTSNAALQTEPAPIVACTVSQNVQNFELLIEDMETELGEGWGDLSFEDASAFMSDPEAKQLEFIAIAVNTDDEDHLPRITELVKLAKETGIGVILIAEGLSPQTLHQLLRLGADDFVPYPLPKGALHEAIERLRTPPAATPGIAMLPQAVEQAQFSQGPARNGAILPIHGLSGGVGASTFAVNLAWELAVVHKKEPPRVCLLDLDLQFGSASTYLDLPRSEAVYEMWSDTASIDAEAFDQALVTFNDTLHVLTAPPEILPLDFISPEDINNIIDKAKESFDFVIIDMPRTLVQWTETVLSRADVYFALLELDMRSAQNTLRMLRALKSEDLPFEKLRYALNRAPKFTDLSGKSRVKRMAENLDIDLELMLPDGGKAVAQAGDHGLPLAETAAKLPLRKEVQKLAKSLFEHAISAQEAAG